MATFFMAVRIKINCVELLYWPNAATRCSVIFNDFRFCRKKKMKEGGGGGGGGRKWHEPGTFLKFVWISLFQILTQWIKNIEMTNLSRILEICQSMLNFLFNEKRKNKMEVNETCYHILKPCWLFYRLVLTSIQKQFEQYPMI